MNAMMKMMTNLEVLKWIGGISLFYLLSNGLMNVIVRYRNKRDFIRKYEGKHFFWYTSGKKYIGIVREEILPKLREDVILIYNDAGEVKSNLMEWELDVLQGFRFVSKLPVICSIEQRKVKIESIQYDLSKFRSGQLKQEELNELMTTKFKKHE